MRPTFNGLRLIVNMPDRSVLRSVLPEQLRFDFDHGRALRVGEMPAYMGNPLDLAMGLSWGVQYHTDAIEVWAVDPDMNLSYEKVREIEDTLALRDHPEIMVVPITREGDDGTLAIIQRNLVDGKPWETDLPE